MLKDPESTQAMKYYPRLREGVSLHINPSGGIIRYEGQTSLFKGDFCLPPLEGMEFVNSAASRLFFLSTGEFTIEEITEEIYGRENVEKPLEPIVSFYYQAREKGHIELSSEKGSRQRPTITGSFEYYVPIHISIELTARCNLRCAYCYNEFVDGKDKLTPDELVSILDEWKRYGLSGVELTGGEPLLYEGFWQVLDYCSQNFKRIALLSNGVLIDEKVAKELGRYRERMVMGVSLDGSCPEVHEALRGKGTFHKTVNAIRRLSEAGVVVRVGMTITPTNIFDLENTVKLAQSCGAKFFSWSPATPFGRGKDLSE